MKNLIDAVLTSEDLALVIQKLSEVEDLLPFLINVPVEERRTMPKMGRKTVDFVGRALIYGEQRVDIAPKFLDIPGLRRDLELREQVQVVVAYIEALHRKVMDTYYRLGAEAYAAALSIYRSLQNAKIMKVEGVERPVNDLAEQYKKARGLTGDEEDGAGGEDGEDE